MLSSLSTLSVPSVFHTLRAAVKARIRLGQKMSSVLQFGHSVLLDCDSNWLPVSDSSVCRISEEKWNLQCSHSLLTTGPVSHPVRPEVC